MKTTKAKKSVWLSMALSVRDRTLLDRAAGILELPPSVWGRSVLLREASKIVRDSTLATLAGGKK